jgi:CheY-like chemotaxis protein
MSVSIPPDSPDSVEQQRQFSTSSPRRVLVVDDSRDTAESTATLVRLWGHEVRVAFDGAGAISLAASFHPNLILLDIGLPGMSGYEVVRRLRESALLDGTVLVAMTGYGSPDDRRRTREAGFHHHIMKPAEPSLLQELLAAPDLDSI